MPFESTFSAFFVTEVEFWRGFMRLTIWWLKFVFFLGTELIYQVCYCCTWAENRWKKCVGFIFFKYFFSFNVMTFRDSIDVANLNHAEMPIKERFQQKCGEAHAMKRAYAADIRPACTPHPPRASPLWPGLLCLTQHSSLTLSMVLNPFPGTFSFSLTP